MGNLTTLKANFKKNKYNYISTAVIIIMILPLFFNWNDSTRNELETQALKDKLSTTRDSEKLFMDKYDASQGEIKLYQDSIANKIVTGKHSN